MQLLLNTSVRLAREIAFIDPYFTNRESYRTSFLAYFEAIVTNRPTRFPIHAVEIQTSYKNRFSQHDIRSLEQVVPATLSTRIVRVRETNGQQFHDRFILTDLGCISFGHSLDVALGGPKTKVVLSLLDVEESVDLRNSFGRNSLDFDRVEEIELKGRMGA